LLSSANNTYHRDYFGETESGAQLPMMNVFARRDGKIHHFWGTDSLYEKFDDGGDSRHIDAIWPLWHLLDMTPQGRGSDWYPRLRYDAK